MSNDFNAFMSIFFPQPLSSQALDPLEIIRVTEWEGLNFSLGRKEMDLLSTNKLTQEKCQRFMKFCCSGGKTKIIIPLLWIRSGNEWLVKKEGYPNAFFESKCGSQNFAPTHHRLAVQYLC